MKSLNFLLLLLLLGCSQTGSGNLSSEKQARHVDQVVFSNPDLIKKYANEKIVVNANFNKIEFDLQLPDDIKPYRMAYFFISLVRQEYNKPFILVPTSNTDVYALGRNDPIVLKGTVRIINADVCFFVAEVRKQPFTKK